MKNTILPHIKSNVILGLMRPNIIFDFILFIFYIFILFISLPTNYKFQLFGMLIMIFISTRDVLGYQVKVIDSILAWQTNTRSVEASALKQLTD